ncbi:MAG TPA: hypothetical protein VN112_24615 [Ensifer sp.]|nr:hypothetical protein [Ensifer sp.]
MANLGERAGKSTLNRLVQRLNLPESGRIMDFLLVLLVELLRER